MTSPDRNSTVVLSAAATQPHLGVSLLAEIHLAHVSGQVGGPQPAVAALLVDPGVEVAGGVAGEAVGQQQEVVPLQHHHHQPRGQRLAGGDRDMRDSSQDEHYPPTPPASACCPSGSR